MLLALDKRQQFQKCEFVSNQMIISFKLVLNTCFFCDGDVVRVNHAWEVEEEAEKQVDDDGTVVSLHQVDCKGRACEAHQVG